MVHSSYCIGSAAPHLETFTIARGAVLNIFQVIDKAFKYSSPYCKKEPKDRHTHFIQTLVVVWLWDEKLFLTLLWEIWVLLKTSWLTSCTSKTEGNLKRNLKLVSEVLGREALSARPFKDV